MTGVRGQGAFGVDCPCGGRVKKVGLLAARRNKLAGVAESCNGKSSRLNPLFNELSYTVAGAAVRPGTTPLGTLDQAKNDEQLESERKIRWRIDCDAQTMERVKVERPGRRIRPQTFLTNQRMPLLKH
ncbi:hypothetical protein EJ08DRAFT_21354 [Tothia fuscella]|uniref:Uncharacterized protein n=1 Tax=Tothia fuscella TaxID=1048955 RepID=A0A9P4NYD3_9PEZI|nr:hypothetical protein EJ08DRAFT_21354 [Tothia fuscella]